MSETKESTGKKPLKLKRPGKLELKKTVETGQVRQSFSHGRSKTVQVEVKRKRSFATEEAKETAQEVRGADGLTAEEREARARALQGAALRGDEAPALEPEVHEETAAPAEPEAPAEEAPAAETKPEAEARPAEPETAERRPETGSARQAGKPDIRRKDVDIAKRRATDEEARQPAEGQVRGPAAPREEERPVSRAPGTKGAPAGRGTAEEEAPRKGRPEVKKPAARRGGEPRRRTGKLTVHQVLEGEENEERTRSLASVKRQRERDKQRQREMLRSGEMKKQTREVVVPEAITVQELANRMAERGADVVKALMRNGVMATITQSIDADTAELIIEEFGHKVKRVSEADVEIGIEGGEDDPKELKPRAPVVTVMGHVDHGKTSLLDALRETDVVAKEAGGITQHIGAYQVVLGSGAKITFLDTPGHAAFTAMRSRGAQVTDLVVLVVAADDSIQPQTVEAINHAKAAEVPIIVAINKMDAPGADATKVRNDLLQHELVPEAMGGDVQCIEVSAKERTGLDDLEEAILLQAELLELKANPDREAQGVVVEARLDKGRGPVATLLVERGTIQTGDTFVAGAEWGRVRALINDRGEQVESAGPSEPVEVLGLQGAPAAGDPFVVVENEARAREISEYRHRQIRSKTIGTGPSSVEQMFAKAAEGQAKTMALVVKADVQGSVEAITGAIDNLATDEVKFQVLHAGVGGINESDVTLAEASNAMIVAFNVRANAQARTAAERAGIDIRYYSVIYDIIDDLKALLSGMLEPVKREKFLGYAEILEVFRITKVGNVAGCRITQGTVKRGAGVRLLRDDTVIHEGKLATLKRFKEEVREVREGYECGMAFENYQDIRVGDQIECYEVEEVARTVE